MVCIALCTCMSVRLCAWVSYNLSQQWLFLLFVDLVCFELMKHPTTIAPCVWNECRQRSIVFVCVSKYNCHAFIWSTPILRSSRGISPFAISTVPCTHCFPNHTEQCTPFRHSARTPFCECLFDWLLFRLERERAKERETESVCACVCACVRVRVCV